MPPSERSLVRYLAVLSLAALAATALVVALNAAMDPYGIARDGWYRLRPHAFDPLTDETPDGGLTDRVHAVARSRAPVLLLGTSRTMAGFETDEAQVYNAGKQAGSLREIERIMEAAASRLVPPRLYVLEAPPLRSGDPAAERFLEPGWPPPTDLYLSPLTTRMSLRLAVRLLRGDGGAASRQDFQRAARQGGAAAGAGAHLLADAADQGADGGSADLRRGLARLAELCARSGSTLVVYEPPLSPLAPPALAGTERRRASVVLNALARARARTGCRVEFLDLTAEDRLGPAARDPRFWYDHLHFQPAVGDAILRRALAIAPR